MRIGLLIVLLCLSHFVHAKEKVWLLIDTGKLTLEVKKGKKTLEVMKNISIGRNGAGFKMRRGDDVTPLGIYRISWINEKSPYYRFFGLSYPSEENAIKALDRGIIDPRTLENILTAHKKGKVPPQNTNLGGRIGIHGVGRGDEKIHRTMNWTHGCIALTNHQIDRLSKWVTEDIVVKVK